MEFFSPNRTMIVGGGNGRLLKKCISNDYINMRKNKYYTLLVYILENTKMDTKCIEFLFLKILEIFDIIPNIKNNDTHYIKNNIKKFIQYLNHNNSRNNILYHSKRIENESNINNNNQNIIINHTKIRPSVYDYDIIIDLNDDILLDLSNYDKKDIFTIEFVDDLNKSIVHLLLINDKYKKYIKDYENYYITINS
jgi:hypothetical protein